MELIESKAGLVPFASATGRRGMDRGWFECGPGDMLHSTAPEGKRIARELIAEHHSHLNGVSIVYVYNSETPTSKGKERWERARKVTGLNAFLAQMNEVDKGLPLDDEFFVIEIARPVWLRITENEKRALVDHELCHCKVEENDKGKMVLVLAGHDVEEFTEVIGRHGAWRLDVQRMLDSAKAYQGSLFNEESDVPLPTQEPEWPTDGKSESAAG